MLLAIVDANYRFIYTDIGCNGRISDGGVYRNCNIAKALENNSLSIPQASYLAGTNTLFPYVIVADDAFTLKPYLLKPYSQVGLTKEKRIFNYRLSRARRVVENAFGILANRFRVFMTRMGVVPEKVEAITMACCILHNFLLSRQNASSVYAPPGYLDTEDPITHQIHLGDWHTDQQSTSIQLLTKQGNNHYCATAKNTRDTLCHYFNTKEGEVEWQWDMI